MFKINKDFIKKIKKRTGFVLLYSTMLLNITACSSLNEDDKSMEISELIKEYESNESDNSENNKKTIQDVLKDFGYTDKDEFYIARYYSENYDIIGANTVYITSTTKGRPIIRYVPQETDNIFQFKQLDTNGYGTYTYVYYDLDGYLSYLDAIENGITLTLDGYELEFKGLVINSGDNKFKLNRESTEDEKNMWYSEGELEKIK